MLRQILLSLIVLAAAGAAYVLFVPGASEQLARFGISLPVAAATSGSATPAGQAAGQGQPQGQGGASVNGQGQFGGGAGGRRGARELVVVTAPAASATINDALTAIGEGKAAHSVTVMSPANGTLVDLVVSPGDRVAAGAEIGHLDSDAEQIAFDRATLALKDAEATLARTQELAKSNAATTVQINTAQLARDNADLERRNAMLALERRTIVSPIPGTVGLFQVNPGNMVTPQTTVTTVEDTAHIRISFWVPERYASSIAMGAPVSASVVALPGTTIEGTVSAIDNRIDPASRTLQVEAQIPNEGGRLKPGMSFSVALHFEGETFPSVDPLAIQWGSDGSYVWRFADGKVDKAFVEIIQRNSDGVLVKGDIRPGDQVVTQGVQQLTAGASVRLLDAPQGEADANAARGEDAAGAGGAAGRVGGG